MPELPDVETFKRYVDATALHQRIADTTVSDKRIFRAISAKQFASRVRGAELHATARWGKYLFVELRPKPGVLVLHFGMSGELTYYQNGGVMPPYTRVLLSFSNGYHLAYQSRRMLGQVTLTNDRCAFVADRELGPDAMSGELTPRRFAARLREKRGMIKPTLMDQCFLAGLGNVYTDEILFQAGIRLATRVHRLDDDAIKRLFRTMRRVLDVTIRHQAQPDRFPTGYLTRHRGERDCPRCGVVLRKTKVSGRTSYWCPRCQPAR